MFLRFKSAKKGFTIVEILIVLIIIGVIAAFTIPSILKGIFDANCKAQYKLAFRKIAAITTGGRIPIKTNSSATAVLFDTMSTDLDVKGYIDMDKYLASQGTGLSENNTPGGVITNSPQATPAYKNWILPDDGIAYYVAQGISGEEGDSTNLSSSCGSKYDIIKDQHEASKQGSTKLSKSISDDDLSDKACFVVYIDINGPLNGPNLLINNKINIDSEVETITNDIFPIYIGADGAVAGNQLTTITGRIAAGLK